MACNAFLSSSLCFLLNIIPGGSKSSACIKKRVSCNLWYTLLFRIWDARRTGGDTHGHKCGEQPLPRAFALANQSDFWQVVDDVEGAEAEGDDALQRVGRVTWIASSSSAAIALRGFYGKSRKYQNSRCSFGDGCLPS